MLMQVFYNLMNTALGKMLTKPVMTGNNDLLIVIYLELSEAYKISVSNIIMDRYYY